MEKFKIYIGVDKKTGELMSFESTDQYIFEKKKKNLVKEYGGEAKKAILTVEVIGKRKIG